MVGSWWATTELSFPLAATSTEGPHKWTCHWDSASRHIAAANMSAVTKAVGMVVSESSVLRFFCHGQRVGEIIPELWMMDHAAHLRGTVNREQVGELTALTPRPRQASAAK
jgi:hypothetical protein